MIALIGYGNVFLQDPGASIPDLGVLEVFFVRYKSREDPDGQKVAATPADWFRLLRDEGVEGLKLAVYQASGDLPEHIAVSFSNAVQRSIEARSAKGFEQWYPKWAFNKEDKKWTVEYRSLWFDHGSVIPTDLGEARLRLSQALDAIQAFSRRPETSEPTWIPSFEEAKRLLDNPDPESARKLLPDRGYGVEARQLITACIKAYVFGGMGSWNDYGYREKALADEQNKVGGELYEAIKYASVAATNSFAL